MKKSYAICVFVLGVCGTLIGAAVTVMGAIGIGKSK